MALTEMLWGTTLTAYNLYNNVTLAGLRPYTSWAQVHSHFERVQALPTAWLPAKALSVMMLFWWCIPASSIIFFAFFGFGEEAVKEYKRVWDGVKSIVFWRRNARSEKKDPMSFGRLPSTSRPSLKPIMLKWSRSTSTSEAKSPTSMISQSTITVTAGQVFDSESDAWKRSKSLEFASESHVLPIPTYYESTLVTEKSLSGSCSPTSSTHPTLIGQLIDPKRNDRDHPHNHDASLDLPDIDESDAFTIDSFSYYEDSVVSAVSAPPLSSATAPARLSSSAPSTTRKSLTPSTPPHPPSPRFVFPQHSLPPPPARKAPRAIGSLSSLLRLGASKEGVDERGRFSRGDFSFHHSHNDSQQQGQAYTRSPLQYETYPHTSPVRSGDAVQDVPEDVEPASYIQSLGVLSGTPEMDEFASGYAPLKRKKTMLGVEGGAIDVTVERSASVDEGSVV
jgi:hypothetical protein